MAGLVSVYTRASAIGRRRDQGVRLRLSITPYRYGTKCSIAYDSGDIERPPGLYVPDARSHRAEPVGHVPVRRYRVVDYTFRSRVSVRRA